MHVSDFSGLFCDFQVTIESKVRRPPEASAQDRLRKMVKCEERKRDERDKRDGRDQAEQKVQKEKKTDEELRALRLFRDLLVLKTFVGYRGVLHGLLFGEPTIPMGNSVQDVFQIVFDRDLPDGDDNLTSLLLSYTHMKDQARSTSQQGFESTLDPCFRERLSAEERLALFTAYQHLNRFPAKEIYPHSNNAAKKNKAKSKAKKKACGPAQASEETRQPGGTGPSGPEQASEETRQPGGAGP